MSRPGFYNDNEYRSYPFVFESIEKFNSAADFPEIGSVGVLYRGATDALSRYVKNDGYITVSPQEPDLPNSLIVDAGFIMGLDANYDDKTDYVWLEKIDRVCVPGRVDFKMIFRTTSANQSLIFTRTVAPSASDGDAEWSTEYAQSAIAGNCGGEPMWSGFIVTGRLNDLIAYTTSLFGSPPADSAITHSLAFGHSQYRIEPARVQNLQKAYLRSISVGNYSRATVPACTTTYTPIAQPKTIIVNKACMSGNLRLKEGYNCRITQTNRDNTISIGAAKGSGAAEDSALCENGGEIPFTPNEIRPIEVAAAAGKPEVRSKFLSGGPSCKDLIFSVNGIGGRNVNLIGGANFSVRGPDAGETSTLHIDINQNRQGGCDGS